MDPKGKKARVFLPEGMTRDEILIRLPVKSLVRFQAVCKSWESLLYDPDFMKAHVARKKAQNPKYHAPDLIALYSSTLRILSPSDQTFKQTGPRVFPLFVHYLLGSVNGLVCVSKFDKFFICNPAIGKIKDTYLAPRFYDKARHDDAYARILGFGWDHLRDDYKIVACYLSQTTRKCAVYSSSSNSWTKLVIPDSVFPARTFENAVIVLTPTTIVNNCPYWRYTNTNLNYAGGPVYNDHERECTTLFKFDVEINEFRVLPEFDYDMGKGTDFDFVNIKDCLAVMVYNKTENAVNSVDVHSLDEVSGIWIKMYTMEPINSDFTSVLGLKGYLFGGEIMFNDQGKLFGYDPTTKVITNFHGCSGSLPADCFSYTPTLVLLPEMKNKVQYVDHIVSL